MFVLEPTTQSAITFETLYGPFINNEFTTQEGYQEFEAVNASTVGEQSLIVRSPPYFTMT